MRSLRRVTLAPMALPSRSLKQAIDFLALVISGFWPVMSVRSVTACSRSEAWADGVADAHVHHDLLEARDLHDVAEPEVGLELVTDLVVVACVLRRGTVDGASVAVSVT